LNGGELRWLERGKGRKEERKKGTAFDKNQMAVTVIDSENLKWQSQPRQFAVGRQSQRLDKEMPSIE
jgi:hypothetical protein